MLNLSSRTKRLEPYAASQFGIGTRLRHARLIRGARLKEVAAAAGCSESLVSKLENNKLQPSLHILHKLCTVLKINMSDLFSAQEHNDQIVMRSGQRPIIELDSLRHGKGIRMERLIPYSKGHILQGNIHVIAPGGSSDGLISHEGEEVGYLIEGEIELMVGDKVYRLSDGDSFAFRSEIPHGYRNCGNAEARIVWVNTPPTL